MERMLHVFRRHSPTCPHREKGRAWTKCSCPCWVDGFLPGGARILASLKTRNWTAANRRTADMEIAGAPLEIERAEITTAAAVESFHADQAARGLTPATLKKYRQTTALITGLATKYGCRVPSQITQSMVREMREGWSFAPGGHAKHLERMRQVFRFFAQNGWITENPLNGVRPPKVMAPDTLPLEPHEFHRLVAACDTYPFPEHERDWRRRRAIAFLLVLRHTGLRLGDAVRLSQDSVDAQGRITVARMGKTARPVKVLVPSFVLTALESCRQNGTYFVTGVDPRAAEGAWWKFIKRLAKHAGVKGVHPHRFRDTFSVELLKSGVSIEDVSKLLGHSSIRTTEKHYAPWVISRQDRLDRAVAAAIGDDSKLIQGAEVARKVV